MKLITAIFWAVLSLDLNQVAYAQINFASNLRIECFNERGQRAFLLESLVNPAQAGEANVRSGAWKYLEEGIGAVAGAVRFGVSSEINALTGNANIFVEDWSTGTGTIFREVRILEDESVLVRNWRSNEIIFGAKNCTAINL